MKDTRQELIDLIQAGYLGVNGVRVIVEECDDFNDAQSIIKPNMMVSFVKREFKPFYLDKIAEVFRNEINNDIMELFKANIHAEKMAVLIGKIPSFESMFTIKYMKIIKVKGK